MDDKQGFYVESTDGRKFKMVIRGDLGKLSVAKIRRYLKSYGVPDNQQLLAGSLVLEDDMLGEHFGLHNEGVLHLRDPIPTQSPAIPTDSPGVASTGNRPHGPSYPDQSNAYQQHLQQSRSVATPKAASTSDVQPTRWMEHSESSDTAAPGKDTNALQQQLRDLKRSLEAANARNTELESQLAHARQLPVPKRDAATQDGLASAKESLSYLADKLRVSLQFDRNLTCVVGTDEDFSILLTYDPATERLYLYSTLLTELPSDTQTRMKLYEVLLEGSLLSREVCGGGIGVSTKNSVVVLTTSLPVKHCQPDALCDVVPVFIETLGRWRDLVGDLVG
ncbi:hypothetical protein ABL78_6969 [Leptomonas seymouri]|uniref:Ubiquitin-like domain-containing protein n=1 Tax=Leptomonas seymouri TaxID=5684 RepID=A0A0N1HT22_LEPSE|nr:hypothetical protein ABL78_6969 [Leptomonas seymouri]|eukprot:KPI83994.1 hypothetical protein ABL78_6969 [Leptomonas seymouri]